MPNIYAFFSPTFHNYLLCISHTAFLIYDGGDLRVQDNYFVSWYEKGERKRKKG